ncbi:unnamed protein product [Camellia sinensis]
MKKASFIYLALLVFLLVISSGVPDAYGRSLAEVAETNPCGPTCNECIQGKCICLIGHLCLSSSNTDHQNSIPIPTTEDGA